MKKMNVYCLLALCALFMFGCGKKVDETKPIDQVKAEAEKMDVSQLKAMALKYQAAIQDKTTEMQKVTAKLKDIPVTKLMDAEATKIKADLQKITQSITDLKARFDVYYTQLKQKGGDLTGLNP